MSKFEHSRIRIYLDLDGVVADFHKAVLDQLGFDHEARYPTLTDYKCYKNLGMSEAQFYGWMNNVGVDFWANLPFTKYGKQLFAACQALAPTYLCTSPTRDNHCAPGKIRWIRSNFGGNFDRYSIGSHKHMYARKGHILIDDSDANIDAFLEEAKHSGGGDVITYPRPWNRAGLMDEDKAYAHVLDTLHATITRLQSE